MLHNGICFVGVVASEEDRNTRSMAAPRERYACDATPYWYHAPVIVGGSGGSGTRGVLLLLEQLGVKMACSSSTKPSLEDKDVCELPCNRAEDCALINALRPAENDTNRDALGWLAHNFSQAHSCHANPERVQSAMRVHGGERYCGGSQTAAMEWLKQAVRPEYRLPYRWGLKNPHSTYHVSDYRVMFPCLVYVNTVRDLDVMVALNDHFENRVNEAERYGFITTEANREILRARKGSLTTSNFLGSFLTRVNLRLEAWLQQCMAGRGVHVPLQRMVALAPQQPRCVDAVARPLALALRLPESHVRNVTHTFAASSLALVQRSIAEAHKAVPPPDPRRWRWPPGSPLEPSECGGVPYFKPAAAPKPMATAD